jgi:hypothetical protein
MSRALLSLLFSFVLGFSVGYVLVIASQWVTAVICSNGFC